MSATRQIGRCLLLAHVDRYEIVGRGWPRRDAKGWRIASKDTVIADRALPVTRAGMREAIRFARRNLGAGQAGLGIVQLLCPDQHSMVLVRCRPSAVVGRGGYGKVICTVRDDPAGAGRSYVDPAVREVLRGSRRA